MHIKILNIILTIILCISTTQNAGSLSFTRETPSSFSIASAARPADAKPVAFSSSDFERLLRKAMGKAENEPIYANELAQITLINISDDLMTFDGRLHDRLKTAQTITELSLLDLEFFPNLDNFYLCDIVARDLEILPSLSSLRSLSLIGCSLDNCDVMANMDQLTYLSLARNNIHTLSPLSGLTQLKSLNITGNPIASLSALETLVNLTDLTCAGNKIGNLDVLKYMPKLERLRVQGTDITSLEALSELPELKLLDISYIQNVTLSLKPLCNLENLEIVWMTGTKVDSFDYIPQPAQNSYVGGEEVSVAQ